MEVAYAGNRVSTVMFTLITRAVATRAVYRISSTAAVSTASDVDLWMRSESAARCGAAMWGREVRDRAG
ncbi:hypothetical protein [Streptomyces sp. NPDC047706]|uniref:hypothetical protein n=1 Tax=Streptomyces sp. NPDC047706 TaxID=3365486 RepID=UPI003712D086